MLTLERGSTPREELELLNSMRAQWNLPAFAGFKTKNGYAIGWEEGAEPLYEISGGADGIFYRDLREPHIVVDESAITLSTTQKALWAPARTILPANYWRVGKVVKLSAFGKATTDGTAGNYVFEMGYGSGDAPTPLVIGATVAGTVSQTNVTWRMEGYMECRSIGATGTCRMWAETRPVVALLASTLQPYLMPAATPADVTIDTTVGTNALSFQVLTSAGADAVVATNIIMEALN